jgi:hypothetical protein
MLMPAAFDLLDQVRWFSGPDERRQMVGQPHGIGLQTVVNLLLRAMRLVDRPSEEVEPTHPLNAASALLDMT